MAEMKSANESQPSVGHEMSDANARTLASFGIGLAVLVIGAVLLMWGLFGYFAARERRLAAPPPPLAQERRLPPPPQLQVAPEEDLQKLREAEEAALNSYGWVSREAGVVRIPVDQAMELLIKRGLPARSEGRQMPENRGLRKKNGGSQQ